MPYRRLQARWHVTHQAHQLTTRATDGRASAQRTEAHRLEVARALTTRRIGDKAGSLGIHWIDRMNRMDDAETGVG